MSRGSRSPLAMQTAKLEAMRAAQRITCARDFPIISYAIVAWRVFVCGFHSRHKRKVNERLLWPFLRIKGTKDDKVVVACLFQVHFLLRTAPQWL